MKPCLVGRPAQKRALNLNSPSIALRQQAMLLLFSLPTILSEYPNILHVTFGEINEANKTQGHPSECVPLTCQANHLFPRTINQQWKPFAQVAFQLKCFENEKGIVTHDFCSRH